MHKIRNLKIIGKLSIKRLSNIILCTPVCHSLLSPALDHGGPKNLRLVMDVCLWTRRVRVPQLTLIFSSLRVLLGGSEIKPWALLPTLAANGNERN